MVAGELFIEFSKRQTRPNLQLLLLNEVLLLCWDRRATMVPSFLTKEQGHQIATTGKSICFLREICLDKSAIPGLDHIRRCTEERSESLLHLHWPSVEEAYATASRHLLHVLLDGYHVRVHLQALRHYLLLGQGDFVNHLMKLVELVPATRPALSFIYRLGGDRRNQTVFKSRTLLGIRRFSIAIMPVFLFFSFSYLYLTNYWLIRSVCDRKMTGRRPELDKPASTRMSRHLASILDKCIRSSNSQYDDSDVLKRLDVRISEPSLGDVGWDVFSLDYKVDGPLATVRPVPICWTLIGPLEVPMGRLGFISFPRT